MKAKVKKDDLALGLGIVGRAVAGRSTLPVLSHILVQAVAEGLKLSATNLTIGIETTVNASVETEGGITVPAKLFADYIGVMDAEEIELSVDEKTVTLSIDSRGEAANIKGFAPDEFPPIAMVEGNTYSFPSSEFVKMIESVTIAASTDESKPILTCVQVNLFGQKIKMAAADGFRLSENVIDVGYDAGDRTLLIPAAALRELVRISKKFPEETIEMVADDKYVEFKVGSTRLVCTLEEGHFPDYRQLIPSPDAVSTSMTTSRREFLALLKTTDVLAKTGSGSVVLDIADGKVSVSSGLVDAGDSGGDCEAEMVGNPLKIGFAVQYLIDVLWILDSEKVTFSFTTPIRPCVLRHGGFTHVIMPM